MIKKIYLSTLLILAVNITRIDAQTFDLPAVGLKSHQTLEVVRVEAVADRTTIYLSIENKINGGTFCVDKNTYMIKPDGTRIKLRKANGIPHCPSAHKFSRVGEMLEFSLVFPSGGNEAGWFDLVEDCSNNCFSVYGILLNNPFSRRIDDAMNFIDRGQLDSAIGLYTKLIEEAGEKEAGITGSLYSDLITLLNARGYRANAADWYHKLEASNVPGKEKYLDNLNFRGIKF